MPSHWESGVLGDYVSVKRGGSPRPIQEYLSNEGLRWLKIADVSGVNGPYISEIKEHIKEEGLRKTVHLEPGSLVLSNSATPGIPKILSIGTCIHDGWLYFPQSEFTNEWLYCYFLNVRQELVRMANGSVFQNLKTDIVKHFEIIRPDDETLDSFQKIIAPLFGLMEARQQESKQLAALRDALLPKLMSGEIDVSKIDLRQLNSHLPKRWYVLLQIQGHPYIPATAATAVTQACVGTMKVWYFLEFGTTLEPPGDPLNEKGHRLKPMTWYYWSRGADLNHRPSGYEPDELTRLLHPAMYVWRFL